jgi:hypothetical protein
LGHPWIDKIKAMVSGGKTEKINELFAAVACHLNAGSPAAVALENLKVGVGATVHLMFIEG